MKPTRICLNVCLAGIASLAAALAANAQPAAKPADKQPTPPTESGKSVVALVDKEAQVRHLLEQVKRIEERQRALVDMQRVHRDAIRAKCGLSPENVVPTLLTLERDAFQLSIELTLKQQRRRLLEEQIAKSQGGASPRRVDVEDAEARYAMASLEVAKAALEKAIEANRKVPVSIPDVEIGRLRAEVAKGEALLQVRIAERNRRRAGANAEQISQKLQDLAADATIDELRLKLLEEKNKTLAELRPLADRCAHFANVDMPANHKLWQALIEQLGALGVLAPGTSW